VGLEAWLTERWYGHRRASLWLLPLSWLYGGVIRIRRALYRAGLLRAGGPDVPTVVVGNITAGGTGKTPLVIFLVERLLAAGRRPGVASRGYGGVDTETPRRVDARSAPEDVGDEPVLIVRRTGVPVVVCRDRRAAAQRLAEEGVDLILCDDGLQHYALRRDTELAVIDGERGLGNGHLLPAGPLREPAGRLREVDLVIRNGGVPVAGELLMRLVGQRVVHLASGRSRPLEALAGEVWHAVAGIGHPERFFGALDAAGLYVIRHPLPDHARFDEDRLPAADGYPVLMTEKDAVKCAADASDRLWYLPVDASFGDEDAARLLDAVLTTSGLGGEH
jgi:tetraacyldisaccharide 4'-kinase